MFEVLSDKTTEKNQDMVFMTDIEESSSALTQYALDIAYTESDLIEKAQNIAGAFALIEVQIIKDGRLTQSDKDRLTNRLEMMRHNIIHYICENLS